MTVIGTKDGRVYERLMEAIARNPLNQVEIVKGFNETIPEPRRAKL